MQIANKCISFNQGMDAVMLELFHSSAAISSASRENQL